jgi:hypothetical protein
MSNISLLPAPLSDRIPPFDPDHLDSSDVGAQGSAGLGDLTIVNNATSNPMPMPTRITSEDSLTSNLSLPNGLENPMTPRNDAGPFILDGGAGQPGIAGRSSSRNVEPVG